jgi:hypothetical protein
VAWNLGRIPANLVVAAQNLGCISQNPDWEPQNLVVEMENLVCGAQNLEPEGQNPGQIARNLADAGINLPLLIAHPTWASDHPDNAAQKLAAALTTVSI